MLDAHAACERRGRQLPDRSLACPGTPAPNDPLSIQPLPGSRARDEEEQVEREILIANLQWNFGTNKTKVAAHFDEELPKAIEEPAMQFCLGVCLG